jgi:hypothetical protein
LEPIEGKSYYIEPVEIEIYLKKAGKVRTIIKDMYIELIDVKTQSSHSEKIFSHFISKDEPIDLMEIMNVFPEYISIIFDSYYHNTALFEKLSMNFKAGIQGSVDSWRLSLYFTELLIKYEPTVASADYIGDFQTYNINYLVKKLYTLNQIFLLEDTTVAYLIKRRYAAYEGKPRDKEFDKLVELWHYNIKEKDILI